MAPQSERCQDHADHRRPGDGREAEHRGDQPSSGDLDGQDREARSEGQQKDPETTRSLDGGAQDYAARAKISRSSRNVVLPRSLAYQRRMTLYRSGDDIERPSPNTQD